MIPQRIFPIKTTAGWVSIRSYAKWLPYNPCVHTFTTYVINFQCQECQQVCTLLFACTLLLHIIKCHVISAGRYSYTIFLGARSVLSVLVIIWNVLFVTPRFWYFLRNSLMLEHNLWNVQHFDNKCFGHILSTIRDLDS